MSVLCCKVFPGQAIDHVFLLGISELLAAGLSSLHPQAMARLNILERRERERLAW